MQTGMEEERLLSNQKVSSNFNTLHLAGMICNFELTGMLVPLGIGDRKLGPKPTLSPEKA